MVGAAYKEAAKTVSVASKEPSKADSSAFSTVEFGILSAISARAWDR